jgi:hypothetical protein
MRSVSSNLMKVLSTVSHLPSAVRAFTSPSSPRISTAPARACPPAGAPQRRRGWGEPHSRAGRTPAPHHRSHVSTPAS